jgi:uncharacterized protein YqjF (DUF2071 family)
MAGSQSEERVRWAMVEQTWRHVTLLHWRTDPQAVAAVLPRGLVPDVVDGASWISIVAFDVEGFKVCGLPLQLASSSFAETNLRTYVRDRSGRDGIWFLSIDVPNLLNVAGGRVLGVPYNLSAMSVHRRDGVVEYQCRRRRSRHTGHDLVIQPGPSLDAGERTIADLLAGRWRAFSWVGRLIDVPVEHESWSLQAARVAHLDESIFPAAGLSRPPGEPLVHFADGLRARLGPPRLVRSAPTRQPPASPTTPAP